MMNESENGRKPSSIIYISEPDVIDVRLVAQALEGTGITAVLGSPTFEQSRKQNYDTLFIRSATTIDKNIKQHFPYLKNIIRAGTGLDKIDLDYCKNDDISVYNAPGANADAVSEYVVAMILYVLRRLDRMSEEHIKAWNRFVFQGRSVREHTVGIVGFGHIGRLLYRKLNAFSVPKFLVSDPYISPNSIKEENIQSVTLDELLKQATIISLHVPLTHETHNLINEQKLSLIQSGSLLINASRGGIVDEPAVISRTQRDEITYIADTITGEPVIDECLLKAKNIIITPHIASLTSISEQEMQRQALRNFLKGITAKAY